MRTQISFGLLLLIATTVRLMSQEWERVSIPIVDSKAATNSIVYSSIRNVIALIGSKGIPPSRTYYLVTSDQDNSSWTSNPFPNSSLRVNDLTICDDGTIVVATSIATYYTTDQGATWDSLFYPSALIECMGLSQFGDDGVLIVSGQGLFYSKPVGSPVDEYNPKFANHVIYDAYTDTEVFVVNHERVVSLSDDGGATWRDINTEPVICNGFHHNRKRHLITYYSSGDVNRWLVFYNINTTQARYLAVPMRDVQGMWDTNDRIYYSTSNLFTYPEGIGVSYYDYDTETSTSLSVTKLQKDTIYSGSIVITGGGYLYLASNKGLYRTTEPVVTAVDRTDSPLQYQVSSYPSPVALGTPLTVSYSLERAATLSLQIKDILGRTIREEPVGQRAPGQHTYSISTAGLEPGMYFYALLPGNGAPMSGKMVVR